MLVILAPQVWDDAVTWTAAVSGTPIPFVQLTLGKGYPRMFDRDIVSD